MTHDPQQDGIQRVLNLPPSYEEALRTSAAYGSTYREVTGAFGSNDCNRDGDVFVRTLSLPPSYEEIIHNTAYPTASRDDVIHL